jgi:hypothetical protein
VSVFRSKISLENYDVVELRMDSRHEIPGQITFDDRGNARYLWRDNSMLQDGDEGTSRRLRALSVANLELADQAPATTANKIPVNKTGLIFGYDPYDSGVLLKFEPETL